VLHAAIQSRLGALANLLAFSPGFRLHGSASGVQRQGYSRPRCRAERCPSFTRTRAEFLCVRQFQVLSNAFIGKDEVCDVKPFGARLFPTFFML